MWWIVALTTGSAWDTWEPAVVDTDYVSAPNFTSSTTFKQQNDETYGCDTCLLYTPTPLPAASETTPVCDCGVGRTVAWKRMELSSGEVAWLSGDASEDDDDLGSGSEFGRCDAVSFGWTWDLSPPDTTDIVMTIDPGPAKPGGVRLSGANHRFLTSRATTRGQQCGVVMEDVFQARPVNGEGDELAMIPSSTPSSLYCELDDPLYGNDGFIDTTTTPAEESSSGGTTWIHGWNGLLTESLARIDGVCRCSLGRVPAMMEMNGVYFQNREIEPMNVAFSPSLMFAYNDTELADRADQVNTTYGWTEPLG
jgi:hypothetical protein